VEKSAARNDDFEVDCGHGLEIRLYFVLDKK
jgi:hypothetical protein